MKFAIKWAVENGGAAKRPDSLAQILAREAIEGTLTKYSHTDADICYKEAKQRITADKSNDEAVKSEALRELDNRKDVFARATKYVYERGEVLLRLTLLDRMTAEEMKSLKIRADQIAKTPTIGYAGLDADRAKVIEQIKNAHLAEYIAAKEHHDKLEALISEIEKLEPRVLAKKDATEVYNTIAPLVTKVARIRMENDKMRNLANIASANLSIDLQKANEFMEVNLRSKLADLDPEKFKNTLLENYVKAIKNQDKAFKSGEKQWIDGSSLQVVFNSKKIEAAILKSDYRKLIDPLEKKEKKTNDELRLLLAATLKLNEIQNMEEEIANLVRNADYKAATKKFEPVMSKIDEAIKEFNKKIGNEKKENIDVASV